MSKIKFSLIIFSVMFFLGASQVPKNKNDREVWLIKKVERLRKKAGKILYKKEVTKEDELAYFEEFPNSFEVFNIIFAYSSKKDWGIPNLEEDFNEPRIICNKKYKNQSSKGYNYVLDCITAFFHLHNIDKSKLYNKIINIASNGKWDVDFIASFRSKIFRLIVGKNLKHFCNVLSLHSDAVIQGFWFFLFDGPHPPRILPHINLHKVKVINLHIYNLMKQALQEVHQKAFRGCFLDAPQVPKSKEEHEVWLAKKVDRLRKKVAKILYNTNVTKKDELAYFEEFPDSFEVFNVIFAKSSKKGWGVFPDSWRDLYKPRIIKKRIKRTLGTYCYDKQRNDEYVMDCIDTFLNLKSIDKSNFYNKIINIASGGKWNADYINHFQLFIRSIVIGDLEVFCKLLSLRSDTQVRGFWFFYFDEPYPPKTIPENLHRVKEMNLRIYQLMEVALQEARKGAYTRHLF